MDNLTKSQKRELRRVVRLAHERELGAALTALEAEFRRWRAGEIDVHELNDAIHQFHQDPSRKLWVRYTDGRPDFEAAFALQKGILTDSDVGPEVLPLLKDRLVLFGPADE